MDDARLRFETFFDEYSAKVGADGEQIDVLIGEALTIARPPIDPAARGSLVTKFLSVKQRPRRPSS